MVTSSNCSKLRAVSLFSYAQTAGQASSAAHDRTSDERLDSCKRELCIKRIIMRVDCVQGDRCNRGDESARI